MAGLAPVWTLGTLRCSPESWVPSVTCQTTVLRPLQHPTKTHARALGSLRSFINFLCPFARPFWSLVFLLLIYNFSSCSHRFFFGTPTPQLASPPQVTTPGLVLGHAPAANCVPGIVDTRTPQLLDVFQPAFCPTKFQTTTTHTPPLAWLSRVRL